MFKTKRDVDRHVSHILNRLRDEKEVFFEKKSRFSSFFPLPIPVSDSSPTRQFTDTNRIEDSPPANFI